MRLITAHDDLSAGQAYLLLSKEELTYLCTFATRCNLRVTDFVSKFAAKTVEVADSPKVSGRRELSARKKQIVQLVARGLKDKEIAAQLGIAEGTVADHLTKIFHKMNVRTRTALIMAMAMDEPASHELPTQTRAEAFSEGISKGEWNLTDREQEVVALLVQGLKNKEIADELGVVEQTVRNHLKNIYDKMGVNDRLRLRLSVQSMPPVGGQLAHAATQVQ